MSYQTVNPYTAEVIKDFPLHTDAEVESAVSQADTCFAAWKQTSFLQRTTILKLAAKIPRSRSDEFAGLVTLEMGKLIAESRGEVALSAEIIDYYADHGEEFLAPHAIPRSDGEATVVSSPLGVLVGVEPWNFPYYQLARVVAPNLMAGNVVIVKHAPSVPQCALAFVALVKEAGIPDGVPLVKGASKGGTTMSGRAEGDALSADLRVRLLLVVGGNQLLHIDEIACSRGLTGAWIDFHWTARFFAIDR